MEENNTKNTQKISFVVTSYNYSKFIEETLNSIKNQTYKNIEIIAIDDFSTDNSVETIENFIKNNTDLNIKLIKHEKNYGQLKAILTGLENATGEFVSFIDSDDIIFENYAQTLLTILNTTNIGFVSCKNAKTSEKSTNEQTKTEYLKNKPFGGWFWYPMSSAMFKKESVDIILNYKNTDDWKICPDKFIFNLINLLEGSALINSELFFKRQHGNNAGHFNRTKLNIENNKKIRKKTLNFIKENKAQLIEKYGKNTTKKFILKIYFSYLYIPFQILKYVTKILTSKIH